jgi:predicted butyrate kinase (DUF1464 family)
VRAGDLTPEDIRLAYLAAPGEPGGLGGLTALGAALARSGLPTIFLPGVIHLPTVPAHRKINRVDMGTADKVCTVALALSEEGTRRGVPLEDVSLILVELGGAFTAAIAIDGGRIVDGIGGTSGPVGLRSPGALDGEVAFLAGKVEKALLFSGGVLRVRGDEAAPGVPANLPRPQTAPEQMGWSAYLEGVEKAVAALAVALPHPDAIVLSGRVALVDGVVEALVPRLGSYGPVRRLDGFARTAKHAAQGAALLADGLAGGTHAPLVDALAIREARGTALDYLVVISPAAARQRLGIG